MTRVVCPALVLALAVLGQLGDGQRDRDQAMVLGANFSCRHAEWLGLDCRTAYLTVLQDLGVKHLRLSVYWDEIEPQPGVYDFRAVRWQLDQAAQHGAAVVLTIGIKGQRWPEVYVPAWLWEQVSPPPGADLGSIPTLRDAALAMLTAVVTELGGHPAIEAWQVENEPLIRSARFHDRYVGEATLRLEVEAVRRADRQQRPIVLTHPWTWILDRDWQRNLALADILGLSYHTKRQEGPFHWFYLQPFHLGPFSPHIRGVVSMAAAQGKRVWITELQAEPWEQRPMSEVGVTGNRTLSPERLQENVRLARATGVERAYLWGIEWWLYQRERWGETRYWEIGQRLFRGQALSVSSAPASQHRRLDRR